eukprot:GHVS01093574.1.p1 GENE.GHVS01093574.1~~GHVS01093574.1.p1  ORF type:complete len:326 (-),score=81.33 GHVS01093574.1:347-1282(-)
MSCSCVDPTDPRLSWLFVGNKEAARPVRCLKALRIRYIVNATPTTSNGGLPNYFEKDPFFSYCRIPIQDNASENLTPHFQKIWEFLETARIREDGNALVHCNLGVSRSVTLVCSYVIRRLPHISLRNILHTIQTSRPIAKPNDSFMQQLHLLDAKRDKNTKTVSTASSVSMTCLPSSPLLPSPSPSPPSSHSYPTSKRKNNSSTSSTSKHRRIGPCKPPMTIGPALPHTMRRGGGEQSVVIGPQIGPTQPTLSVPLGPQLPSHHSVSSSALPSPPSLSSPSLSSTPSLPSPPSLSSIPSPPSLAIPSVCQI